MGFNRKSDFIMHTPSGSSVPGKIDANPFMGIPRKDLVRLIEKEHDGDKKKQMISVLKQYDRQVIDAGVLKAAKALKALALYMIKCAELGNPAINIPYYQDVETDQGQEEIIDSLEGLYDNDNIEKFDYARQGIRPLVDIDISEGDFLSPKEPVMGPVVKPQGDGEDPVGMENPFPPTGGDIDTF